MLHVDRLTRTILTRTQLKTSLLPPQLRRVVELRFDHQNPKDDAQIGRLLNASAAEVREWTLMAFARIRKLDGVLPVPELEPDEERQVFTGYSADGGDRFSPARCSRVRKHLAQIEDEQVELAAYRETVYDDPVAIQGFKCKATEALFKTEKSQRFGAIRKVATRKLTMLEAATVLEDLKSPPGNRLEALVGDRAGQHSIRVNDQFRICFVWTDVGPKDVEISNHYA